MDLWSLAGNNLYGLMGSDLMVNPYYSMTVGSVLNPYSYLNVGQSLLSGGSAFAQQLSRYGQYYNNSSLQSALQVIEKNPELKEKVTDTLKDVYQAMVSSGSRNISGQPGTQSMAGNSGIAAQNDKSKTSVTQSGGRKTQAADAYKQQMSFGRRTPTMHAPSKLS